jgi:hypothetical protein
VWIDTPLRDDFAAGGPRLYRWQPLVGFGIEHLTIDDRSIIADTEAANTFKGVHLDGVLDGWDAFPYAAFCGHDHKETAETARPL